MVGLPVPEHGVPAALASFGEYVATLQREAEASRQRQEELQTECDKLSMQVSMLRQDKLAQDANLRAEIAALEAKLSEVAAAASTREQALSDARAALEAERAAAQRAAGSTRTQAAGLEARVAELEAQLAVQARQLVAQQERCAAELAQQQQMREAAEKRHQGELEALAAERDQYREAARKQKETSKQIVKEYKNIKSTFRRRTEELRQLQAEKRQWQQQQQPGHAGGEARVTAAAAAASARRTTSDDEGSGSEQLNMSELQSGPHRMPSISSSELEPGIPSAAAASGQLTQPTQHQQSQQRRPTQRSQQPPQQCQQQQETVPPHAAAWQEQQQRQQQQPRSPAPLALAEPPPVSPPPAADAWPEEEPPQVMVPPTDVGNLPASDDEAAGDALDDHATQLVPLPVAPVICTQQAPLVRHPLQQPGPWGQEVDQRLGGRQVGAAQHQHGSQQQQQVPEQQQREQHQQQPLVQSRKQEVNQPQRAKHAQQGGSAPSSRQQAGSSAPRGSSSSGQAKRPLQAGSDTTATGAGVVGTAGPGGSAALPMAPPPARQPKRHQSGDSSRPQPAEPSQQAGHAGEQLQVQGGHQPRRRRQQQGRQPAAGDDALWSPVAGLPGEQQPAPRRAAGAAVPAPPLWGEHQQQVQQEPHLPEGAPWPTGHPAGQQQDPRPQRPLGGGWKPAVRNTAAHTAFELGADGRLPALQQQGARHDSSGQLAGQQQQGRQGGGNGSGSRPGSGGSGSGRPGSGSGSREDSGSEDRGGHRLQVPGSGAQEG